MQPQMPKTAQEIGGVQGFQNTDVLPRQLDHQQMLRIGFEIQGVDYADDITRLQLHRFQQSQTGEELLQAFRRMQAVSLGQVVAMQSGRPGARRQCQTTHFDRRLIGCTPAQLLARVRIGLDQQHAPGGLRQIVVELATQPRAEMDDGMHGHQVQSSTGRLSRPSARPKRR